MDVRDDGLADKVAVISGGASGIGRALAVAYARCGTRTVIGYYEKDPHDPYETVQAALDVGGQCEAVKLDVRSFEQTERIAQVALDRWGRLDVCVAAAGILRRQSLDGMSDDLWDDLIAVDLRGVLHLFRSCSARMFNGGSMIGISSISGGVYGWENHCHYAAAKSGVVGLCRALAVELASRRVRVNAVIPGLIETPQSLDVENSLGPDGLVAAADLIPMGRVGDADEVARAIRFLSGDDASYVTGQSLVVDGGLTVRWPS